MKVDEKPYRNIFLYDIEYVMVKKFIYVTINNVNPLYLIISKINDYIKESNGNKNLMLDSLDESKDILKKRMKNCQSLSKILLDQ